MSNDPEQEFFSDGITEDIITDLSKVSGCSCSAATPSSLQGQGLEPGADRQAIGSRLCGRGQRAQGRQPGQDQCPADRSASDGHIWAERYDRDLTDIFAVQDEITKTIVEQLKVKLLPEEKKAIEQAPTDNVEAYTNYLRGRQFFVTGTKSS